MLINGKWKKNLTNNVYNTYNPSNQNNLGDIQNSSKQDILEAIEVAYFAFKDWSQRSPYDRSKLLYKAWENMLKISFCQRIQNRTQSVSSSLSFVYKDDL